MLTVGIIQSFFFHSPIHKEHILDQTVHSSYSIFLKHLPLPFEKNLHFAVKRIFEIPNVSCTLRKKQLRMFFFFKYVIAQFVNIHFNSHLPSTFSFVSDESMTISFSPVSGDVQI